MIRVTKSISLDESEVTIKHILASGPGGQNVNKVATAAQLRFNIKERLIKLAGRRATSAGILIITAKRYRTQERNRQDAIDRLVNLIGRAIEKPKPRKKTKPSLAQKQQRLEDKRRRARKKQLRQTVREW
jgi:ribosome-associated protein